ncbi:hemolysin family protein [Kineosporia sp. A_224]|uniref:hemolysin family protein n=1 Tax=Kineosporia sp. A_224 TaxID=1962180 RepID=UPI000B4BEBA1|nr:hemolysin family protein [Kineosporia sp. A_224]
MSDLSALGVAVLLLLGNAFFVGAEFAVMSARHSRVEPLVAQGSRAARTALWAMEHVSLMLAACQLGITVCSLGLGAVAEPAVAHLLEGPFAAAGLPEALVHPVAFAIALTLVVYLHVVVGEMVPKNLALAGPERAALVLAPPLVVLARVVRPLIAVLNAVANGVLRLLRVTPKDEVSSTFTAEEVRSIVTESTREGLLEDGQGLLAGAIELGDRRAGDVMVAWDRLVTVSRPATPEDVERLVAKHGFSRFPVVPAAGTGDVVGYLHVKDLLYADDERYTEPVPDKRVRTLASVSPRDDVEDVLAVMQRSGSHLARVVGTTGETLGVVFLEDVLEELVGEVRDATQRRVPR